MIKRESDGDRICLGVIGCGKIAEYFHLPAALATPGVELAVLCDPNPNRLQACYAGLA